MRQQYEKIQRLGAEVLVVTFSAAQRIPQYLEAHDWPFPVVADPEFEAYRAFELQKGTWWQVAGPRAIVGYLKLMFRGRMPHSPTKGDDVKQLGGDFVLDRSGRLLYLYRSQQSTDRPGAEELLDVLPETASNASSD